MRYCEELIKHLQARRKLKSQETSNFDNVDEKSNNNEDVFCIIVNEKISNSQILDSKYSFHMCPYKECFDTNKECNVKPIPMDNDFNFKAIGIGTVKGSMFDSL